jgi:hypothetical protein
MTCKGTLGEERARHREKATVKAINFDIERIFQ